jgi:hypothetical protein
MEYISRFSINMKMASAFHKWLLDNEARFEAAMPEGGKYLGTYFVVRNSADYTCETRWEVADYTVLGNTTPEMQQINREIIEFINDNRPMGGILLKSAREVQMP